MIKGIIKHYYSKLFLMFIFFYFPIYSLFSFSIKNNILFDQLTNKDGLSQNSIIDICQDNRGLLWFATFSGLNIYDGKKIKIITHDPNNLKSLSNNRIYVIYNDKKNIWIGTEGGGLNKFNYAYGYFKRYNTYNSKEKFLDCDYVYSCLKGEKNLWVGTKKGLYSYDYKKDLFNKINCDIKNIYSMYIRGNNLYLGTQSGIYILSKLNNKLIKTEKSLKSKSLKNKEIRKLLKLSEDTILIGTSNGLYEYNFKRQTISDFFVSKRISNELKNIYIYCLSKDQGNNIWIGTVNGLLMFNQKKNISAIHKNVIGQQRSLNYNWISSIFRDRSGVLWIGTGGKGLNKSIRQKKSFSRATKFTELNSIISSDLVFSIFDEKTFLWVGFQQKGLYKLNKLDGTYKKYLHFKKSQKDFNGNIIRAIIKHKSGIFIGVGSRGLYKYINEKDTFIGLTKDDKPIIDISDQRIVKLYIDSKDNLWIGTQNGLNKIRLSDYKSTKFFKNKNKLSISGNTIQDIVEDDSYNIWIGTTTGLSKYSKNKFINYKHDPTNPKSLSSNHITCTFIDKKKRLWLGTTSGINLYKKNSFKRFTNKDGLAENTVYSILEDSFGFLWIATNRGLSRLNPDTLEFFNYDNNDGLNSFEYNHHASFNNGEKLFFGGTEGIDTIITKNIEKNRYIPQIIITSFSVDNEDISKDKIIEKYEEKTYFLSYKNKTFSIDFAALDYNNPSKNQYAYRIESIDKNWNYLGTKNSITLKNLSDGKYKFYIKGSNNDGVWNEKGTYINIVISPPFWNSIWFRIIALILVGLTIFFLYKQRIRIIIKKMEIKTKIDYYCNKHNITEREKEIILLLIDGKSNKEIEEVLYISLNTVRNHIHNIFTKLKIKSRVQLIKLFESIK